MYPNYYFPDYLTGSGYADWEKQLQKRQEQADKIRRVIDARQQEQRKQAEQQKENQVAQAPEYPIQAAGHWYMTLKGGSTLLAFSTEAEAVERARTFATAYPGKTYQVFSVRHEFTYNPAAMAVTSF